MLQAIFPFVYRKNPSNPIRLREESNKEAAVAADQSSSLENGTSAEPDVPRGLFSSVKDLIGQYKELTKFRLSSMVVGSTMLGYFMADDFHWQPTEIVATCGGTFLAICAANAFNQIIEIESDKRMNRTGGRPLSSGRMSVRHAVIFGLATGTAGVASLQVFTNPVSAGLAAANIFLYTLVYTPLKKVTVLNTWVGAVVGLIPPLIGWTSRTGGHAAPGAWVLGYLLFAWQIPHFLALSYYIAEDYNAGGYRMLSADYPDLAPGLPISFISPSDRVLGTSLAHCYAMLPVGPLAWHFGLTHWVFVPVYTAINGHLIWRAHGFYRKPSATSARVLFMSTLHFMTLSIVAMPLLKAAKAAAPSSKVTEV